MSYATDKSKTPKRKKNYTLKNIKKGNVQGKYKVLMLRGSHKK